MTTAVDIANLALSAIGTRSRITALNEASAEARECNKWYATTRRQIIRAAMWGCCSKWANLTLLKSQPGTPEFTDPIPTSWDPTVMPPPGWLYEYAYPDDCLKLWYVVPMAPVGVPGVPIFPTSTYIPTPEIGVPVRATVSVDTVKVILTDQQNAIARYAFDNTDPDQWDEGLQQSIIYGLAAAMALALTGDKALSGQLNKLANETILQARVMNGNEGIKMQTVIPDWIKVRGYQTPWGGSDATLENFGPLLGVNY